MRRRVASAAGGEAIGVMDLPRRVALGLGILSISALLPSCGAVTRVSTPLYLDRAARCMRDGGLTVVVATARTEGEAERDGELTITGSRAFGYVAVFDDEARATRFLPRITARSQGSTISVTQQGRSVTVWAREPGSVDRELVAACIDASESL